VLSHAETRRGAVADLGPYALLAIWASASYARVAGHRRTGCLNGLPYRPVSMCSTSAAVSAPPRSVRRRNRSRRFSNRREEHRQVERRGQYGVPAAPPGHDLQIVVQQRHAQPERRPDTSPAERIRHGSRPGMWAPPSSRTTAPRVRRKAEKITHISSPSARYRNEHDSRM
jgi:hypothetical protein